MSFLTVVITHMCVPSNRNKCEQRQNTALHTKKQKQKTMSKAKGKYAKSKHVQCLCPYFFAGYIRQLCSRCYNYAENVSRAVHNPSNLHVSQFLNKVRLLNRHSCVCKMQPHKTKG